MASRHEDFLASGGRLFGVVIDSPEQNAATVERFWLPFPMLSDPDRVSAITPYGVANPTDERNLAIPAVVIITPDGEEAWRWVARDFADRIPEEDVLAELQALGLSPTSQTLPESVNPQPGRRAMPLDQLGPYLRGARFAAVALGNRHPAIADDTAAYVEEMDRFLKAVTLLKGRQAAG